MVHDDDKISACNKTYILSRAENWMASLRPYFGRNSCFKAGDILHGFVSLNHREKRSFVLRTLMALTLRCQGRGSKFLKGREICVRVYVRTCRF